MINQGSQLLMIKILSAHLIIKRRNQESGITFGLADTATKPLKPIKKTIGIITMNATN